eukprot:TRINITY_DN5844_c0_g3_i1.p1 TRINITY_DN5844_c0_g3~~TRINITY_DN5844_c0_g3_i1.p1  ORF type:complete len:124 (+),score=8.53 TRINITY_DN5844_c0_g3_i1:47-418(+)
MVVHALHMGNGLKRSPQGSGQAVLVHVRVQAAGPKADVTGIGHWRMQHDFLVLLVRQLRQSGGVSAVGQESQGDGLIQGNQSLTLHQVMSHVIDDDGDSGRELPLVLPGKNRGADQNGGKQCC